MKRLKNFLRYIIILALDIYLMYIFHSYINFLLLVCLIVFPIFSYIALRIVAASIDIDIMLPVEPMRKKDEFYVQIIIKNSACFPLLNATIPIMTENRFYLDFGEHTLNVPVRAKAETKTFYPIVMDYCGRFRISISRITLMDYFGMFEIKLPFLIEKECLILPDGKERKQEAGIIYQKGVTEAMESKEKGYDFSEVSGIREYIPGDKLQNIHWKLSVKKDELMVKERISVSAQQLNVLVELFNDEKMCVESVLELTDSITKAFVEMNFPFSLFFYSHNLGCVKGVYIGNEIERTTCLETILYDRCYRENGLLEDLFLKEHTGGTYLYIGCGDESRDSSDVILGQGNVLAELRTNG